MVTSLYLTVGGASGLPDHYTARVNGDHPMRIEGTPVGAAPATVAFRTDKTAMVVTSLPSRAPVAAACSRLRDDSGLRPRVMPGHERIRELLIENGRSEQDFGAHYLPLPPQNGELSADVVCAAVNQWRAAGVTQ